MAISNPAFARFAAANPSAQFGSGASENEVSEAETTLGVMFPALFRAYLKECGRIEFGSAEFYGLGPDVEKSSNLVESTLVERNEADPRLPTHLIPFLPDGYGNHFCIVADQDVDDPPVVFWDHEDDDNQQPKTVAASFSAWLNEHTTEWA